MAEATFESIVNDGRRGAEREPERGAQQRETQTRHTGFNRSESKRFLPRTAEPTHT